MMLMNGIVVSEPESFPNPIIRRSAIRTLNVLTNNDTSIERKTVIDSGSGKLYELGTMLKKAIFGQVVHAVLLRPVENDNYVRTEHELAIKVYSKRMLRTLQGRTQENPLMEITALQFIGDVHPNIMGQLECCTDEENIYSIMRFCRGGELFDYIEENGPMQEIQAKSMFRQLVCGMNRLQELGIGHRDMSLENILYDGDNLYVIIDFGMCMRLKKRPVENEGQIGTEFNHFTYCSVARQTICGKKNYIAPEVLRGDEYFNPLLCDIWAAGIILFITLTGVPPVDKATNADERFTMICDGRLGEMLHAWNMDLSNHAVHLIQNLLRERPTDRLTLAQILQHPWLNS